MIFWLKAGATPDQPNEQRARLIGVLDGKVLRVEMQSNGKIADISPYDTCGVEFGSGPMTSIKYEITSVQCRD